MAIDWWSLMDCHPDTGELFWLQWGRRRAGSRRNRFVRVYLNDVPYKAHDIIWEMFNGPIPDGFKVVHINGRGHDNRLDNLALVNVPPKKEKRNGL